MNTPTRKQHFLTRFLMAGFACRKKRREIYTHVFRAGQPPFEDNIRNIGGERDFYANPKNRPTEAILERRDTRHAQVINKIRQNLSLRWLDIQIKKSS
jgi:hypothetical protein